MILPDDCRALRPAADDLVKLEQVLSSLTVARSCRSH